MTTGLRFQPVPGYLTVAGPRQKTATRRNRTGEAGKLSGSGAFSSGHALPQQTTRPRRAADWHGQPGARGAPILDCSASRHRLVSTHPTATVTRLL